MPESPANNAKHVDNQGDPSNEAVTSLPRGGLYVRTSAGPLQFGVPPETIKDSMAQGLAVPTVYIVPRTPFNRQRGLNIAECEFPAYYNFFILRRRIRLIVDDAGTEARVRGVFQESLFGPRVHAQDGEFDEDVPPDARPDFRREMDYFRTAKDGKRLDVDTLIEFLRFDDGGVIGIGPGVEVRRLDSGYDVVDNGAVIAHLPNALELPDRHSLLPVSRPFEPPSFGVTVLGASHGFDPSGKTTGIVIWIGGRGILVDPPVDATELLRDQGVAPKLIDGIVLTHCHADHDSGTFQKILEESRVTVYTTPTILNSFLRKYSSLSGLSEDLLRRTFVYHPVKIGAPTRVHGAEMYFFYTLHSIPAIGLEVFYGGKSLAFSGDTLYDPAQIRQLQAQGVLSPARAEQLINFPWYHSVVLHEAGVPPLHTPISSLAALPDDVKERLYLVHIAAKDVPEGKGLKAARTGIEHTLRIEVPPTRHADAIQILEAFQAVDLFRDFPLSRASEILQVATPVRADTGERIIEQGSIGDAFYIIISGVVSVRQGGVEIKRYHAGDYFGETALVLGQPRIADVVAVTDVSLVRIARYDFLYLLRDTALPSRLMRLAKMREERSWDVFERNSVLRAMTSAQKTQLQSFLTSRPLAVGEVLWFAGEPACDAFLIDEGVVAIEGPSSNALLFQSGAFLGEFDALRAASRLSTTARVVDPGKAFHISRDDLCRFFQENPGVLVSFFGTRFVELSHTTGNHRRAPSFNRVMAAMAATQVPYTPAEATTAGEIDRLTLEACRRGDRAAFRRFVATYQNLVFAFLSRMLGRGPHVEDLAQETFLRAYKALPRFEPQAARTSTWLLTIARNCALDARKRRALPTSPLDDVDPPAHGTPETERQRAELARAIEQAASELPEEQREALVLAELHGLSMQEIGDITSTPPATVKTRLFRARERLKSLLSHLFQDTP